MNHPYPPRRRGIATILLAAAIYVGANGQDTAATPNTASNEDVVVLSPFQVTSQRSGYYEANSMSGTRFNTKIEDIGSSITVVSKEQMEDFGILNINDLFLYVGNAEGTGTFTDFQIDRNGSVIDNTQLNPNGANRIRGIGPANISLGNFEMSGRVPVDPSAIEAVEVSRGPNANVFGLGNAAGTLNMVPTSANLSRNRTTTSFRVDDLGGNRATVDFNRVFVPEKFAVRGSAVFQHDAFHRKPSGTDTTRLNAMVKYRPFHDTTITASHTYYTLDGTRPNNTTPRDAISYWAANGAPTWDPVTFTLKANGTSTQIPTTGRLPDTITNTGNMFDHSNFFINENGLAFLSLGQTGTVTNPVAANGNIRLMQSSFAPVRTNQPLFGAVPAVGSKAIYDYSRINLAAVNRLEDRANISTVVVDQRFFSTPRQQAFGQIGWLRESVNSYARNVLGIAGDSGTSAYLAIDVNERMIDGSPNPNFLRPYMSIAEPRTTRSPLRWDTYRLQLAYELNFTQDKGWTKWLGSHQLSGYSEYKERLTRLYSYRDVITSFPSWVPSGAIPASQSRSPVGPPAARGYFRYYVGDNTGYNVDFAPHDFEYGTYTLVEGNGRSESVTISQSATPDVSGGSNNSKMILKTKGAVLQSRFLKDRVITTFGVREDKVYTKNGAQPTLLPDRLTFDYPVMEQWVGNWALNRGRTNQAGVVVKPFPWVSLFANRSDSFLPGIPAQTVLLTPIPDPSSEGTDVGFALNLFSGKLVIRANHYVNKQINAQDSQTGTLAGRALRIDILRPENDPFSLQKVSTAWITQLNPGISQSDLDAQVAKTMGMTKEDIQAFYNQQIRDTNDVEARGNEVEINYNPNSFLTLQVSAADTQSIYSKMSPNLPAYIAKRLPFWETVIDPRTGQKWLDTNYGGSRTARQYLANNVQAPLALAQALEGKSQSQVGRYSFKASGKYRLAGLFSDHRWLSKMDVGGAVRWQDKSTIGYYGLQSLPAQITAYDPNRPIHAPARTYIDLLVGYHTRLFGNKVQASFQLNARNLTEGGGLRAVGAFPDGTPNAFRIVDPRQFLFTTTFEF